MSVCLSKPTQHTLGMLLDDWHTIDHAETPSDRMAMLKLQLSSRSNTILLLFACLFSKTACTAAPKASPLPILYDASGSLLI